VAQTAIIVAAAAANTVSVYSNGALVLSNADLNFNNTATINVALTANGTTQANVAFSVNTSAVATSIGPRSFAFYGA